MCKRADGSAAVVVAADRQVTMGSLTEFEHAVPKVTRIGGSVVAMIAGDALIGSELVEGAKRPFDDAADVPALTRALQRDYAEFRGRRVEAQVLAPHGLTHAQYLERHGNLMPQLVGVIDQQMTQFNLGVELLVAGVDGAGGHLFSVGNPGGFANDHRTIGYAAIGSGSYHAVHTLIDFGHTAGADFNETVFRTLAAKRRAEAAPGVGHEVDLLVVDQTGCYQVGTGSLKGLERAYARYQRTVAGSTRKLRGLEVECERVEAEFA